MVRGRDRVRLSARARGTDVGVVQHRVMGTQSAPTVLGYCGGECIGIKIFLMSLR